MNLWPFDFRRPTPAPQPDLTAMAAADVLRSTARQSSTPRREFIRAKALVLAAELRGEVG